MVLLKPNQSLSLGEHHGNFTVKVNNIESIPATVTVHSSNDNTQSFTAFPQEESAKSIQADGLIYVLNMGPAVIELL